MNKYPIELQDEEKACGAYCIAMILKYYHFNDEIKNIKKKARLNQNGISIKGMIECLKSYQIEAKGYEASLDDIEKEVQCPCILYMIYEGMGHFVVLYEIKDDEYVIGDPAKGLTKMYHEEMDEHYGRRVIVIKHVGRVPQLHYKSYFQFLKEMFFSYQKYMMSFLGKGVWIALLGYGSSYFFQILIDYIDLKTSFFYMVVFALSYCFLEMMRTYLSQLKMKEMIYLQKAMDEDYVFQSLMNMLKQTESFFHQDQGIIQSQLLSLFDLTQMSLECFERFFLDGIFFVVLWIGMCFLNIWMTIVVTMILLIIVFMSYSRLKTFQQFHKNYLESHFTFQHHVLELINNHYLIRSFDLFQRQRERSYHIYLDEALLKEKQSLYLNHFHALVQYLIVLCYGVILCLGFYLFSQKALTMGQLMMFYMLVSYCIEPVFNMVTLASQYKQVSLIYEKYKNFEVTEESKEKLNQPITSIRLDDVSYAYGYQMPVLEHIDLDIHHHLWMKGLTGSGKSTLLKLLMGQDEHYQGDIYINDMELRQIDLQSLHHRIGYLNETPTFLHMTLKDNFLCQDEKKIQMYLKTFNQEALTQMFHIVLNEDGSPLSLGQRQVVALIRMLCRDFDVLIVDEAFSHLDTRLANKILRYLLKNDEGKIYIMVNHQTKIVNKDMECVIIEKGKIKK
ncbi:cysteine peptidase family C39 domain-containing protein [Allocoprobacillus halotolerans]|uniref:Cysteine peptidase family C39 domain-containing protein n=1 Tax=Allocoprobacillus halotolerans TaxID=2944914 RepID=A0ABY5I2I3_9FIRM|nr:cysteine peptidase family C39 domain-containing protein [Allocoprobacillus halotolerans]UTY39578.1 cysteine peptidase family C39 domain-containing protein [Allocoprobacillus halotolerans]